MAKNEGGFAFGANGYARPNGDFAWPVDGMTMRQFYKGMALRLIVDATNSSSVARAVGEIADALIAEDEQARKEGT